MIDTHCHIICGVDDGPSKMEQSLQMVREAEKLGIRLLIATPHYHESIFELDQVEENYQELLYQAQQYHVAIKMGYEVFVNPSNPVILRSKKRLSLNRTGRLLMEFPCNAKPAQCLEAIKKLCQENITPVIAHPERNRNFLNHLNEMVKFVKAGCLIQVETASIVGVYGTRIREYTKRMIRMNLVDLVASNAHCAKDYADWYMAAYHNVIQWAGQETASKLFFQNAMSILDNIEDTAYKNVIG